MLKEFRKTILRIRAFVLRNLATLLYLVGSLWLVITVYHVSIFWGGIATGVAIISTALLIDRARDDEGK